MAAGPFCWSGWDDCNRDEIPNDSAALLELPRKVRRFIRLSDHYIYCLGQKTDRGRINSSPDFGLKAFRPGFAPQYLVPAGRSGNRRVSQEYAKKLQFAPNWLRASTYAQMS